MTLANSDVIFPGTYKQQHSFIHSAIDSVILSCYIYILPYFLAIYIFLPYTFSYHIMTQVLAIYWCHNFCRGILQHAIYSTFPWHILSYFLDTISCHDFLTQFLAIIACHMF